MNVVTMSRMALLAGAVALTATLLAQQPDDPTPQPLPEAVAAESDFVPAPIAPSPVVPPDFPAAEAPSDVGTPIPEPRPAEAAHNPAGASAPRETILLEFDPESNTIVTSGTRSEFVEKIKSSLDETKSEEGATSSPIQEATVVIKARPELNHTVLVALINQLKSLGIGRFALGASTNGRDSIKLELPATTSYVDFQKLGAAVRQQQQKGFDYELIVGGAVVESNASLDSGVWSPVPTANAEPSTANNVSVYSLRSVSAEAVVKTLKALFPEGTVVIESDERTNSVIVRGSKETQQVVGEVLKKIDETPELPPRGNRSKADGRDEISFSFESLGADEQRELQQRFGTFENRAQDLAMQIQRLKRSSNSQGNEIDRLTRELQSAVRQAFTIRQSLHRAELAEHAQRLKNIQQSIANRDALVDQIVARRVSDLLDPELRWQGAAAGVKPASVILDHRSSVGLAPGTSAVYIPVQGNGGIQYIPGTSTEYASGEKSPASEVDEQGEPRQAAGAPQATQTSSPLPMVERPSGRPLGQTGARDFHERYTKHLSNMKRMNEERERYLKDLEKLEGSTAPRDQSAAKSLRAVSDSLQSQLAGEQAAFEFLEEEYQTQVKLYELELQQHLETLTGAQREFERMKRLAEQGATTQSKVAEMSAKVRFTQLQIEQARAELDLLLKARPAESAEN